MGDDRVDIEGSINAGIYPIQIIRETSSPISTKPEPEPPPEEPTPEQPVELSVSNPLIILIDIIVGILNWLGSLGR